jgi:hypothetical protein
MYRRPFFMKFDRLEENLEIIPVRKAEGVDKFALRSKLAIWLSCFAIDIEMLWRKYERFRKDDIPCSLAVWTKGNS